MPDDPNMAELHPNASEVRTALEAVPGHVVPKLLGEKSVKATEALRHPSLDAAAVASQVIEKKVEAAGWQPYLVGGQLFDGYYANPENKPLAMALYFASSEFRATSPATKREAMSKGWISEAEKTFDRFGLTKEQAQQTGDTYMKAEHTISDSTGQGGESWVGLATVSASGLKERGMMLSITAREIAGLVREMPGEMLGNQLERVYFSGSPDAASLIVQHHGKNAPGFPFNANAPTEREKIVDIWKERAEELLERMAKDKPLSSENMKDLELMGNLFNLEKLMADTGDVLAESLPAPTDDGTRVPGDPDFGLEAAIVATVAGQAIGRGLDVVRQGLRGHGHSEGGRWSEIVAELGEMADDLIKFGDGKTVPTEAVSLVKERRKLWEKYKGGSEFKERKIDIQGWIKEAIESDRRAKASGHPFETRENPLNFVLNRIEGRINAIVGHDEEAEIRRSWWYGAMINLQLTCLEDEMDFRKEKGLPEAKELERYHKELDVLNKLFVWGHNTAPTRNSWKELSGAYTTWLQEGGDPSFQRSTERQDLAATRDQIEQAMRAATGGRPQGEYGGRRPDYRNAPDIPHDSSFFDEQFFLDWGLPPTFYKLEGFSWEPADMVRAFNEYARLGAIVDPAEQQAFNQAINTLDQDKLEYFYKGLMPLLELRRKQNGTIDAYAGENGEAGTGSIIKGFEFKNAAKALSVSESTTKALAMSLAISGLQVGNLDTISTTTGETAKALVDRLKEKYSQVNVVVPKSGGGTEEKTISIFGNSIDRFQPAVDALMKSLKQELATGMGVSLGAVESSMAFSLAWGGNMANWRWGQLQERYPIFAKAGYLDSFLKRFGVPYGGTETKLATILEQKGVGEFLKVLNDFPDGGLFEAWNYLFMIRGVLEQGRLISEGLAKGANTQNTSERRSLIAKEMNEGFNGKWGFELGPVSDQMFNNRRPITGESPTRRKNRRGPFGIIRDILSEFGADF